MVSEAPAAAPSTWVDVLRSRPVTVLNRRIEVDPERVATPTEILSELGFAVRQVADAPRDARIIREGVEGL